MKRTKVKNVSIIIICLIVFIAVGGIAVYRFFIYPSSERAISDYIDGNFNVEMEVVEKMDSYHLPMGMVSVDVAYLVQPKDNGELQFEVYRGNAFKGMSYPFIPDGNKKITIDNFIDVIENYVSEINSFPIENNTLDMDLCDNDVDIATDIVYKYVQSIDELLVYYIKDYSVSENKYCEYFTICIEDKDAEFYLCASDTKEEIRELIMNNINY